MASIGKCIGDILNPTELLITEGKHKEDTAAIRNIKKYWRREVFSGNKAMNILLELVFRESAKEDSS